MMKFSVVTGLLLGACLSFPTALASEQSQFDIIGVAKDLSMLGISEVWTQEDTGLQQCKVSLYNRSEWTASQSRSVTSQGLDAKGFQAACTNLKAKATKKFKLYDIRWKLATLSPEPESVKTNSGNLKEVPDFLATYPTMQQVDFTLPDESHWQALVRSEKEDRTPTRYTLVLRNPDEPTPYRSLQGAYADGSVLLSPIRVLANDHYGLVTLLFRDTHLESDGLHYFYHPYFMKWPEYSPISIPEAKETLMQAADYAMEPDELVKGPNSANLNYRAYLRLKTEGLSQEEIETHLNQSSPAGKLYWLALLHEGFPERYAPIAKAVLKDASPTMEIIEVSGRNWVTTPFKEALNRQSEALTQH